MTHPLIRQLRFTRSEFTRALAGLGDADARRRLGRMNCISWNIGHMAWQEQRYWLTRLQGGTVLVPELNDLVGYGRPACTPPLEQMWAAWRAVTEAADPFLETLTSAKLAEEFTAPGVPIPVTAGNLLQRVIYHYWYHTGESMAVRQMLGHTDLAEFVGNIDQEAPYTPEGPA
jgi:uncharacterized damage-inducible protein DinB